MLLFKADKAQVIFLIYKEQQKYKRSGGYRHIDIRHIKNWEINQYKVNEIHHIIKPDAVNHITDGTGGNQTQQ